MISDCFCGVGVLMQRLRCRRCWVECPSAGLQLTFCTFLWTVYVLFLLFVLFFTFLRKLDGFHSRFSMDFHVLCFCPVLYNGKATLKMQNFLVETYRHIFLKQDISKKAYEVQNKEKSPMLMWSFLRCDCFVWTWGGGGDHQNTSNQHCSEMWHLKSSFILSNLI